MGHARHHKQRAPPRCAMGRRAKLPMAMTTTRRQEGGRTKGMNLSGSQQEWSCHAPRAVLSSCTPRPGEKRAAQAGRADTEGDDLACVRGSGRAHVQPPSPPPRTCEFVRVQTTASLRRQFRGGVHAHTHARLHSRTRMRAGERARALARARPAPPCRLSAAKEHGPATRLPEVLALQPRHAGRRRHLQVPQTMKVSSSATGSASRPAATLRVLIVEASCSETSSSSVQILTLSQATTLFPFPGLATGNIPSKPLSKNRLLDIVASPRQPCSLFLTEKASASLASQPEKVASWFQGPLAMPLMMMVENVQSGLPGISTTQQGSDLLSEPLLVPCHRTSVTATLTDLLPACWLRPGFDGEGELPWPGKVLSCSPLPARSSVGEAGAAEALLWLPAQPMV
mmetsp:Transcript_81805/g.253873  ORF Transcript_81805/g.253873 Transcript_81805/m.253873 type:complete len:398 (+) Transcript_81805:78-1271(+)